MNNKTIVAFMDKSPYSTTVRHTVGAKKKFPLPLRSR